IDGATTFAEHLPSTRSALLDAFEHQHYAYGSVVANLVTEREPNRTPLVSIVLNMDATPDAPDFGDVRARVGSTARTAENFDVFVNLVADGQGLRVECTYNTDLFTEASIRLRLDGFVTLLADLVDRGTARPIAELEVRSPAETRLIDGWNRTEIDLGGHHTLATLFEQQVEASPEAIAVIGEDRSLTYRELNSEANRLARWLVDRGAGPGARVGIMLERSADLMVAVYASIKAGAAYLPLDPDLPAERLQFMVAEAAPTVVVTADALGHRVPAGADAVFRIDADRQLLEPLPDGNLGLATDPDTAAYVIYTSGSTGRPKAVINTHRGIVNRLRWIPTYIDFDADQTVLQKTPFSFDVSVWELFAPLQVGARLVMARPGAHRDPAQLTATIDEHQVTVVHFVPSMLRLFLEARQPATGGSLQRVLCSGEALTADL
ncbi:MAG: AMP-binding protein, partial [Actinomycetota bacterium]